jgi:hypothetical protein
MLCLFYTYHLYHTFNTLILPSPISLACLKASKCYILSISILAWKKDLLLILESSYFDLRSIFYACRNSATNISDPKSFFNFCQRKYFYLIDRSYAIRPALRLALDSCSIFLCLSYLSEMYQISKKIDRFS